MSIDVQYTYTYFCDAQLSINNKKLFRNIEKPHWRSRVHGCYACSWPLDFLHLTRQLDTAQRAVSAVHDQFVLSAGQRKLGEFCHAVAGERFGSTISFLFYACMHAISECETHTHNTSWKSWNRLRPAVLRCWAHPDRRAGPIVHCFWGHLCLMHITNGIGPCERVRAMHAIWRSWLSRLKNSGETTVAHTHSTRIESQIPFGCYGLLLFFYIHFGWALQPSMVDAQIVFQIENLARQRGRLTKWVEKKYEHTLHIHISRSSSQHYV